VRCSLLLAVLDRVRRRFVATQLHDDLALAPEDCHRHAVALSLARFGGGRRIERIEVVEIRYGAPD
jgi:hypothetical protein